jgi:hypothetical protein
VTAVANPVTSIRLQTVTLPMPEEVRERYMEIREVGSGSVITAIELSEP